MQEKDQAGADAMSLTKRMPALSKKSNLVDEIPSRERLCTKSAAH